MIINESLAPDDVLEINSETGIIKINDEEIYDITGEVFDLPAGSATIEYSDGETARDLSIEIEFTERYP